MRYVTEILLFALLAMMALVTGCEDPAVDVGSLDRKLPAPTLKGSSPFAQNFTSQKYVRVQGACDSRLGLIYLSFDKNTWAIPPSSPDISNTSLSADLSNDRDCGDGQFDVYLTSTDLLNIWGVAAGSEVKYLYIKGETLIGDSETLTLVNSGSGTGSPGGPASVVKLEKMYPSGFAGSDQCEAFRANVATTEGYYAVAPTDVKFSFTGPSATYDIPAYTNWSDCYNGINAVTEFTIPQGSNGVDFFYRFPSTASNLLYDFRLYKLSSLTTPFSYTSVVVRDSSPNSNYRWLNVEEQIHQLYKNTCYPFKVRSMLYNRNSANDQFGGSITLTSNSSQLKFYSDSSCASESSSFNFGTYNSGINAYVKYVPAAVESATFKSVTVQMTGSSGTYTYDSSPLVMRMDLSDKSTATIVDLWGPAELAQNLCHPFRAVLVNGNSSMMVASNPTPVTLATQEAGAGAFYSDSSCTGSTVTSASIAAGQTSMIVYFKATGAVGTYNFNLSSAGLTAPARSFKIK